MRIAGGEHVPVDELLRLASECRRTAERMGILTDSDDDARVFGRAEIEAALGKLAEDAA